MTTTINRHLARGLFLMAIALLFGIPAAGYPIGSFGRAGPGLFPLLVSGLLFLVGLATVVRAQLSAAEPLEFNVRNIGIIVGSLGGFVLISHFVNMTVGIVFLVFCATLAGSSYSVVRNLKIAAGLVAVAFAFHKLLGLNLPLY
jgi:hypothetical protein